MTLEYEEIMSMESIEKPKIDPRLQKAAESYSETQQALLGRGWFDGYEIEEIITQSFIKGAMWMLNNPTGGELLYVNQKSFELGYNEGLKAKNEK